MVGGRDVGMRADDQAGAPVEMMRHGEFLAGRLGVDVDHHGVAAETERTGPDLPLHPGEGIVERVHEHAAHDVHHQDAPPVGDLDQRRAAPGRAGGVVERSDQARLAFDEDERLALVEGVIAERHGIGARVDEIGADGLGDARAAGRVLAVHHHGVERPGRPQARQFRLHCRPAGAAHHVADEQEPHLRGRT